jgi:hypothetical protein
MADDEPPVKASRLGSAFFEEAGLNDTQEVRSGSSSNNRPNIPNAPPTDLDSLAALSAGLGVTYANIDAISGWSGTVRFSSPLIAWIARHGCPRVRAQSGNDSRDIPKRLLGVTA